MGASRVCELKQATIHETIVEWSEGRSFRYRAEGAPMMKSATNLWAVEAHGEQTVVTSTAEVVVKGGPMGRLLEPMLKAVFKRLGARSMASLKYFVEQGHPYPGPSRALPRAPAIC